MEAKHCWRKSPHSLLPPSGRFTPDHGPGLLLVVVVTLIQEFPLFRPPRPDVHASYWKGPLPCGLFVIGLGRTFWSLISPSRFLSLCLSMKFLPPFRVYHF